MSFPRFLAYSFTFALINSVVLVVVGFIAFNLVCGYLAEQADKHLQERQSKQELPWGVPPGYRKVGDDLIRDLDQITNFDFTPKRGGSPR